MSRNSSRSITSRRMIRTSSNRKKRGRGRVGAQRVKRRSGVGGSRRLSLLRDVFAFQTVFVVLTMNGFVEWNAVGGSLSLLYSVYIPHDVHGMVPKDSLVM